MRDGRKQCLWRILCPYIINIKKLTKEEAFVILNEWLDKCDVLRPLDFKITKAIDDNLKNVKQFLPHVKDKVKEHYKELYHILKGNNIFTD